MDLRDAAYATPDPERAMRNLTSFLERNAGDQEKLEPRLREAAHLFSVSQFLANFAVSHPHILFETLDDLDRPLERESLTSRLAQRLLEEAGASPRTSLPSVMKSIRQFRMQEILRITLRDILKKADLVETMAELSTLADVVIGHSLQAVRTALSETYGTPDKDAFTVIGLGKLGGEELNFSSDVDLIFVYGTELGETSGVTTQQGVTGNRISNHEFYCKVGEEFTRLLSHTTEHGFAYRVDLRLRPEGQRGALALALRGYEMYYESWGRAWERAMLIRARPVAGDEALGREFMEMIRPFVYRKYLDFSAIDEIRSLKTRIDATFKKGDIKRGYGGIREIEFFSQALQLIYGGRETLLRERSTLRVLHRLLQKGLIGQEDYSTLSVNYRLLRTLEHRLQQLNDIQTHTVPAGEVELSALSRKMGFQETKEFLVALDGRRASVRRIYDSLFAEEGADTAATGTLFDEEFSDAELREYLAGRGLREVDRAVRNMRAIRDTTYVFQTLRGRRLLGEILPAFVDSALKTADPDAALNQLHDFSRFLSSNESYLEIFRRSRDLIDLLAAVFSQSEYLSKKLMMKPQYLEMIGWQGIVGKSLNALRSEIPAAVTGGLSPNDAIRVIRQTEEIRLGLLFLQRKTGVEDLVRGLSKTAEAVLSFSLGHAAGTDRELAIMGYGKLGGREITFNADLDIIFVTPLDVRIEQTRAAEQHLRMLMSYTREGVAYRVDTRLRPEGSKGPLVSSIESLRKYYGEAAAFWEFQALLKARPVAGDQKTGVLFLEMARDVLVARGSEVSASDIRQMRERILRELSREAEGFDIKLGPGGIEDIEFCVQYLQLANCRTERRLLVQGTMPALLRLGSTGILSQGNAKYLRESYLFYRTLESFLKLRGETVLKREPGILEGAARFMGFGDADAFLREVERRRDEVAGITGRCLGASGCDGGS